LNKTETIEDIQGDIIREFEFFDEWDEKYGYVIELGKKLPVFPEESKVPENIIKGCQSQVWMTSRLEDGKVLFYADSDAIIVKGLISLLIRVLSGHTPDEVVSSNLYFLDKIGMMQHLSQTRSNGLAAMVKQMKLHALAYKAKQ
jgi:cysteine desulfuration protein SufE